MAAGADTPEHPTQRPRVLAVVAVWLACGLLPQGAVDPLSRGVLHVVSAAVVLGGPAPAAGALAAWGLVGLALAVGLVPVPWAVLEALAPSTAATHLEPGWYALAQRPDRVIDALTLWLLAGAAVVTGARLARSPRQAVVLLAVTGGSVALLGLAHATTGARLLFGVFQIRPPDGAFWAPLVNPNHHGALLLLAWPSAAWLAREHAGRRPAVTVLAGAFCLWAWAFPAITASMGLVVALGAQVLVAGALAPASRRVRALGAVGVVLGAAALGITVVWSQPEWWALSAQPRLDQWSDAVRMIAAQPLTGVGAGNYAVAYPPWRTVRGFATFDHLHADVLQWVVETGLVGVAVAVAAWWRAPRSVSWSGAGGALGLGVVGLATHGLVDFAWHVPGVLVLGMLALSAWSAGTGSAVPRRWLVVLSVAQLAAAGWWGLRVAEAAEARAVMDGRAGPDLLARWAPWRIEPDAVAIRTGTNPQAVRQACLEAVARHPGDAELLRYAAGRLRVSGYPEDAYDVLRQAITRDPQDYRAWMARAHWLAADGDRAAAATSAAEAFRRWPREQLYDTKTFDTAFAWQPVHLWWFQELADAPAHWSVRLAWRALADDQLELVLLAAEQAAELRPAAHRWMPAKAEALVRMGRLDAARDYVEGWVAAAPDAHWGWLAVASVAQARGATARAVEALTTALSLAPEQRSLVRAVQRRVAQAPACPAEGCLGTPPVTALLGAVEAAAAGQDDACMEDVTGVVAAPRAWCAQAMRGSRP